MLKTRIKRIGTLLVFILLLSMAADGGLATGGSDASSSKSTEEQTLNLGKSFAHCKRLVKNNYIVWIMGLLTAIGTLTKYKDMSELEELLEYFQKHAHEALDDLDDHFAFRFNGDSTKGREHGIFSRINRWFEWRTQPHDFFCEFETG